MKTTTVILVAIATFAVCVYVFNASWRATPESGGPKLLSHRGVHQTYHREGLTNDTCTAERIDSPAHDFIENTIPSMRAAFAAGADVVELDVHPTTDGYLAVLHDWRLDCRTEGKGPARKHDLAYLKTLDLGYGYTADKGKTFPLRGKGIGMMPELGEVFAEFPDKRFLINFKSREAREGDMLAALLKTHPQWRKTVWGVYGGDAPTWRAKKLIGDNLLGFSRASVKKCLVRYIALGWTGHMPAKCHNTVVMVPIDIAPWLWGWPHLLTQRLHDVGSEIALIGAMDNNGAPSIDTQEQLVLVPDDFSGYLWTDKIEEIGPVIRRGE
ncbi:glycerophosphodiester phosphodiesterase family protein [Gilvimarinus sp. SDUM040013]|uniref:Glycerophosphodiester phosphodiesterase family protein n=1 Tax=Gilvimarinus gilvus TaxID=3058038 RepID=A0ABU4S1X1_9GAMM|nr:glycerophosphodiester phosphodiesterase family protein [Gilvimarinus sp. SDUM040013]MDO3385852.1 glycerophosphodiester phosphodiesterase family protein [Gilvimarinus sp. SDUM040013]MDX6851145.1 glycerophosphodiester phosphodiesterase family protein [Gilvimarinus sp. SDUM040013]